jgi:cyclophilin family peptidyl-prolyl cis-trans isomerase
MSRTFAWLSLFSLFSLLVASAQAQDAAAPPAADEAPAEAAPAEEPAAPAGPSPEAVAAKAEFDNVYAQWTALIEQIRDVQTKRKTAQGDDRAALDKQLVDLRGQVDELVDKIVAAGLAVYQADPSGYPEINATLLAIAQFHITGDPRSLGDGGDQYGKALALIQGLLDAGGGEQWPQLYLWGGVAAVGVNEFTLAQKYFDQAKAAGGGASGTSPQILELAAKFQQELPSLIKSWEAEQKIRAAEAQADDLPRVKFTTNKGDIVLELFENEAPQAVSNFITLVKQGYYDGVVFHRVLPNFMAHGGDPEGTGGGGPGYTIRDEHTQPNYRRHFAGSLSMAKTQAPNTGGSQFFLTFVPTSYLDGAHTAFGRIIEGQDVAASLKRRDPDSPPPHPTPDRIIKAEVLRDRGHDYSTKFEKLPE